MVKNTKRNYRKRDLKRKYRITPEQYEDLLTYQGGYCSICLEEEKALHKGKSKALAVDHIEVAGKVIVRGLLCSKCNMGLGQLGDTVKALERAAKYTKEIRYIDGKQMY